MVNTRRLWQNLATGPLQQRLAFPPRTLQAIERLVAATEAAVGSQVCVVIETALPLVDLWRGTGVRARAEAVFDQQQLADTPRRDAVLVYLLLAERDVEILADTGLAGVPALAWEDCCRIMEAQFAARRHESGTVLGIEAIGRVLAEYPRAGGDRRITNRFADLPKVI